MASNSTTAKPVSQGYTFAGIMLLVLGAFNLIDGFALLNKAHFFEDKFLASNADTWGWVLIAFAVAQLVAGIMMASGNGGRMLGITVASIGMVVWFALLFTFPFAALIGIGINFSIVATLLSTE